MFPLNNIIDTVVPRS